MEGKEGLTLRQQAFVREYLRSLSAAEAARAAGLKNPESDGQKLMKNPKVKAAIKRELGEGAYLAEEAAKALDILLDLMENAESDAVKLRAAQEVLDRAAGKRGKNQPERAKTGRERKVLDYSDPAAVAARIDELRRRLEAGEKEERPGRAEDDRPR